MARQRGRHSPSRRNQRRHWFVAYKENTPSPGMMAVIVLGPLSAADVPAALERVFMDPELDCDGAW